MGLNRAIAGARRTGQDVFWVRLDNSIPDLTGATLSGTIKDQAGAERAITGTLTITDATGGRFTWTYSAADIGTVGSFKVQFKADYGGGLYDLSFPETWIVEPEL